MSAHLKSLLFASAAFLASSSPAWADDFHFTTGPPDGLMASASRPSSGSLIEIETADDFILPQETLLTGGTFTGLLPSGAGLSDVQNVAIEFYAVFPSDSANPPSGHVPQRANSPSDLALVSRDAGLAQLSFTTSTLSPNFTALNSVIDGIHPLPNVVTLGEGPVRGSETLFTFNLLSTVDLPAGHYFFVPQVELASGDFLWLSAPRSLPPATDLQTWIRNASLAPDWLRIGTDITHQGPFNAAFSLDGSSVPEPASWAMMLVGFCLIGLALRRRPNPGLRHRKPQV